MAVDLSRECALCGGRTLVPLMTARDYPAFLVPLPQDLARDVRRADLDVLSCDACGHVQQAQPDAGLQRAIYETYYSHYQVDTSEALVPHYRDPFRRFFAETFGESDAKNRRLLEIGCSSGANVDFLRRFAAGYVGIDASERIGLARAAYPECTFIKGYFPDALPAGTFDVIVSQFNLEHIGDVRAFLDACRGHVAADGMLVIQVPDIAEFDRNGQPNFLAHEHLQYFRKAPLEQGLRRAGWQPVAWGADGPSLICAARPSAAAAMPARVNGHAALERIVGRFTAAPAVASRPLIFYGVGPQLFWLLQFVDRTKVAHVIDDNPGYRGMAVPGSDWPVEVLTPEMLRATPYVVLSLNSIYHERVLDRIRRLQVPATILACRDGRWGETTLPGT
ncbi:MAG TPA: methyltransferase domain-containing protein [Dongiaceae bacterium]|nr:methyltransferase domain-containing protein [Dongiaceae bacterium]